jgi:hypothetical protein
MFPEPTKSLTEWLLDLMAEIVIHEDINRMNSKNMGEEDPAQEFHRDGFSLCLCSNRHVAESV